MSAVADELRERVARALDEHDAHAVEVRHNGATWECRCGDGLLVSCEDEAIAAARTHNADAVLAALDLARRKLAVIEQDQALRDELVQLWGDMDWARHEAHNGCWSTRCENLAERITAITRLVGPARWDGIAVDILRDGTYERVHREAGIQHPPIDWDRVAEVEARIASQLARHTRHEAGTEDVAG